MSEKKKVSPRQSPPADSYFMGRLLIESAICKDPYVQHAALIVDGRDRQLGFGVNHVAKELYTVAADWDENNPLRVMTCAEDVAIARARHYLAQVQYDAFVSTTMYVTGPPSLGAMRSCIFAGIKTIIYGAMKSPYFNELQWDETQKLAKAHTVSLKAFDGNLNWVRDRLKRFDHLF